MAGHIAATAPHLDGSEDIGVWFDVAWASYMHVSIQLGMTGAKTDAIDEVWDAFAEPIGEQAGPTPETWGTSAEAQQGQAAFMAMFGGGGGMGAAPAVGDEG